MNKFTILDVGRNLNETGTHHLTLNTSILELEPILNTMTITACNNIGNIINFNIIGEYDTITDATLFLLANVSKALNLHSNIVSIYGESMKILLPDKSTKTTTVGGKNTFKHVNEEAPITADGSFNITTPNDKYLTESDINRTNTVDDVNVNQQIDAIKLKESVKPIFKIICDSISRILDELTTAY